jgi:hypothetical protein
MPYSKDFADNSIKKENWGIFFWIKLGVPMPYLRDFADNFTMKENLGKKIRVQLKITQKRDGCQTE